MDLLTFISKIIESLAWPGVLAFIVWLLRDDIKLLIPGLKKLKYRDFELDFEKQAEELLKEAKAAGLEAEKATKPKLINNTYTIEHLIDLSPRLSVIEAFSWLENSIREATIRHGISTDKFFGVRNGFKNLIEKNIIDKRYLPAFNRLRQMRNDLTHNFEAEISTHSAKEYCNTSINLIKIINES